MKLTLHEMKYIERLRKQERNWHWGRWIILSVGFLMAIKLFILFYIMHWLLTMSSEVKIFNDFSVSIFFAFLCPTSMVDAFICGYLFLTVSLDWHGNVKRSLLLKLLDAQQSRDDGDPK
jgi:hypothetical protein